MAMNGKTTILFDFDGTLAETMMLIHEVFNQLAGVYGYRHIPEDELEACRHLNVHSSSSVQASPGGRFR